MLQMPLKHVKIGRFLTLVVLGILCISPVDADHAHDLVTRRSITGILVMLNKKPIR
jgi:hypothetical protein